MADTTPHQHPTFQDLLYRLDELLNQPDDLAQYLAELERCPGCRTCLENVDRALDQLRHDAPLVADEIDVRETTYRALMRIAPEDRSSAIDCEDEGFLFLSWGVVDLLIEDSCKAKSVDETRHLAELALMIARRLDTDLYLAVYNADLVARAHAALAHVELQAGRSEGARSQVALARATAIQGTGGANRDVAMAETQVLEADESGDESHRAQARRLRIDTTDCETEMHDGANPASVAQRLLERLTRYQSHRGGRA